MRSALSLGCMVMVLVALGCPSGDSKPATTDAGVAQKLTTSPPTSPRFTPVTTTDPVGELAQLLGGRQGYCVQFRAVPERADAEALAERIEKEAKISVALIEAEIEGRGTWYRLCAGAEPTMAAATKMAEGWTATGGALSAFMEPTAPGQARYFVKERPLPSTRILSEPQARLVLAARPDAERKVVLGAIASFAKEPSSAFLAAVTTPKDASGAHDLLVVDPKGREVELTGDPAPGCAACERAFASAPVVDRRLLGVGDVMPASGDEFFLEETTARQSRVLIVLRQDVAADGRVVLRRHQAIWIGTEQTGLQLLTQVETVEADGDVEKELGIVLTELPSYQNRLCALRTRAEIYDLSPTTPRLLDEEYVRAIAATEDASSAGQAATTLVRAFDRLGDFRAASRMCAAYLVRGRDVGLTQHCVDRIVRLSRSDRPIDAVNAAGMLAESASALRAVIAGPFYEAVSTLNKDSRLTVADENCASAPLVDGIDRRPLAQTIRLARAAKKERVNLAEVTDAVFVTGARDFGPDTPVGKVTARWVERLRIALPARFAAIEALLAKAPEPKAPPAESERGLPKVEPPRPGDPVDEQQIDRALGRPRIILKVHDDEADPK